MKVIDLLNKIANGEEVPKKIKYMCYIFEYDINHKRYESYFDEQIWTLNEYVNIDDNLNDEVEILEEEKKIPEKLYIRERANDILIGKSEKICYATSSLVNKEIANKINEIIDYLDYLKSKEDE